MTRTYTMQPVWTWKCDFCSFEYSLARSQRSLPSKEDMESFGWYIAKVFGDKCPTCANLEEKNA